MLTTSSASNLFSIGYNNLLQNARKHVFIVAQTTRLYVQGGIFKNYVTIDENLTFETVYEKCN